LRPLSQEGFSDAVKQLEQLLSHSRRAFLLGAGCSFCAGLPLMRNLTEDVLGSQELSRSTKSVLASLVQHFEGSTVATIEDYMSELIDLLSIAERRSYCGANICNVRLKRTNYSVLWNLRDQFLLAQIVMIYLPKLK
jgi:hypothetical protein